MTEKYTFVYPPQEWALDELEKIVARFRTLLPKLTSITLQEDTTCYKITLVSFVKTTELVLPRGSAEGSKKAHAIMTTVGITNGWSYGHFLHQGVILFDLGLITARTE